MEKFNRLPKLKNAPHTPVNDGIVIVKNLFGESIPFTIERTLDGEIVIFDDKFINKFLEALSTGCIAKMGPSEKRLLFAYTQYETGILNDSVGVHVPADMAIAVKALDEWVFDEIGKKGHKKLNACYSKVFTPVRY